MVPRALDLEHLGGRIMLLELLSLEEPLAALVQVLLVQGTFLVL